jgi:hypothetical protein
MLRRSIADKHTAEAGFLWKLLSWTSMDALDPAGA